MQSVSYKFKRLFDDLFSKVELKAEIAGVEYTKADIFNVKLTKEVLKDGVPSIGGAVSNTVTLNVIPKGTIPRGAEIKLFLRLVGVDETSEWIPKGTYYIYSRSVSNDGLVAELTCSDGLLKANQTYLKVTSFVEDYWPYDDVIVAEDIANICGLELDDRTIAVMTKGYQVSWPADLTCREVLEYLAVAYGGNWTVTDENTLYLAGLVVDPELLASDPSTAILFGDSIITLQDIGKDGKDFLSATADQAILFGDTIVSLGATRNPLNIKRDANEYASTGKLKAYTGVTIWYDDENAFRSEEYSDEGTVIEVDCPYATQAMADDLYDKFKGLVYNSYDVASAHLTPAAEIGDTVIVDGHAMPLLSYSVMVDGSYRPDISAPPEDEIESEYPYETATQREFARRVKLGSNYYGVEITRERGIEITKTNGNQTFSRAILNSERLAFYDDSGSEAIYFDSNDHEYKFTGNVAIVGGRINIGNDNFIVEDSGNTTTKGNITFVGNGSSQTPNILMNGFMMINDESGRYRMGYLGRATGEDEDHNITEGVALGYGDPNDLFDDDNYFIICTNAGVRLQGDLNEIAVTSGGATYNGVEIATLDDIPDYSSDIAALWAAIHDLEPSGGNNE